MDMTASTARPRAFYAQGGPRRRFARADRAKPGEYELPTEHPQRSGQCPGAILHPAPDGTGLGIWLLVEETPEICAYEYGGGIV